jgi:cysteine desulfurase
MSKSTKDIIYLDYCATTPVHPDARDAVCEMLDTVYGNPSSMHLVGMAAAQHLRQAREVVADGVGCDPEEVFFTSGATEADNLALLGILHQYPPHKAHLITTAIEHHAILHAAERLVAEGYGVTFLPVDSSGVVDPADVRQALRPETRLVSVMMVNNEVGSLQDLAAIGAIVAEHEGALFHTDAVQGVGLLPVDMWRDQVDLLSLSAHKIYGPKGVGALVVRHGVQLQPLMAGGPQEGHLRAGTENMPGIAGLGAAVALVEAHKAEENKRLRELRTWFIEELQSAIPGLIVNGAETGSPHVLSVSFPDAVAEMMLLRLSRENIAVSLGSACTSKEIEPSHVLTAMGLTRAQIEGTLRISFGFPTTKAALERVLEVMPAVWRRSRISS